MASLNLLLPSTTIAVYVTTSSLATVLCLVSLYAIIKTKKTVYATKLFSSGLLVYDLLFLISSSISRFFEYDKVYIFQHLARGFHVSAWIIIGCMALDRLCAINWPYAYLKIASRRRTRIVCGIVFLLSFVQYVLVRGISCYASDAIVHCGSGFKIYLITIFVLMPIISFFCYGKVYRIINRNKEQIPQRHRLKDFKGTLVPFFYIINTAVCSVFYLCSGVFVLINLTDDKDARLAVVVDFVNLLSCMADPLIYVIWFREARFEILKLAVFFFPKLQPRLSEMKIEIFNIPTYQSRVHQQNATSTEVPCPCFAGSTAKNHTYDESCI